MSIGESLPPEVLALAARLGATSLQNRSRVELRLTGRLLKALGVGRVPFQATERLDTREVGFALKATVGHPRAIWISDSLVESVLQHDTRIFGVLPIARREVDTKSMAQEYALRYLLSLPWNPDAIVCNRALQWAVRDEHTFRVSTHINSLAAEAVLQLDSDGLIRAGYALKSSTETDSLNLESAWRVRFSSYQSHADQLIPWTCECVHGPRPHGLRVYQINVADRRVY